MKYIIVYPENIKSNSPIILAANELATYFKKSLGLLVEIFNDASNFNNNDFLIFLGKTKQYLSKNVEIDYSSFKEDCFSIQIVNNNVFIDGKTERAILYGAYDFLERFLGIKFLAFDDVYIPKIKNLIVPNNFKMISNPDFNHRCFASGPTMYSNEFLAQNRFINDYINVPDEYGGNLGQFWNKEFLEHPVHNSLFYVEPEKYKKNYPEWFLFGKDGYVLDLCYSNVGLNDDGSIDTTKEISPVKIIIEKLKSFILMSNKSARYFFFGQMDAGYQNHCKCDKCLANEMKYGWSGMFIRLLNAVDNEIQKWIKEEKLNREVYICTFAYQWTEMPPTKKVGNKYIPLDKSVIPNDNVIVRICSIRANQYYSLTDKNQFEFIKDMINGWKTILKGKKSMFWSYHCRFTYPFCFFPTMQHWSKDLKLYKKLGCDYIFMQSTTFEDNDWQAIMESYVASKLLWDINQDPYMIRKEYIKYYYTIVSDLVSEFINNFETHFEKLMNSNNCPNMALQGLREILEAKYYSIDFWEKQFELINRMFDIISKASIPASEKDKFLIKVNRIKLTIESTVLFSYKDYSFKENWPWTYETLKSDFFKTCDRLGVKKTGEWQSLDMLKEIL